MRHITVDEIYEFDLQEEPDFSAFLHWIRIISTIAFPEFEEWNAKNPDKNHIKIYQRDDGSYTAHFVIDGVEEDQVCERYKKLKVFL